MGKPESVDKEYREWLGDLKQRIKQSQIKASVRVNTEMLELYWSIGADIAERQAESKWGSGVIRKLSEDLRTEFPQMQGFSRRNLIYMKRFYLFYIVAPIAHQVGAQLQNTPIVQQAVAQFQDAPIGQQLVVQLPPTAFPQILGQIPWGHHVQIMAHCKSMDEAMFYIHKTLENGWSRAMLLNFMSADLYSKQGKALNNFSAVLPEAQSDLAAEMLKDPYQFDFAGAAFVIADRDLIVIAGADPQSMIPNGDES